MAGRCWEAMILWGFLGSSCWGHLLSRRIHLLGILNSANGCSGSPNTFNSLQQLHSAMHFSQFRVQTSCVCRPRPRGLDVQLCPNGSQRPSISKILWPICFSMFFHPCLIISTALEMEFSFPYFLKTSTWISYLERPALKSMWRSESKTHPKTWLSGVGQNSEIFAPCSHAT